MRLYPLSLLVLVSGFEVQAEVRVFPARIEEVRIMTFVADRKITKVSFELKNIDLP